MLVRNQLGRLANGKRYAKLCAWVEENIKETLSFYRLPRQHHKNLKSTNMLERSMEEIKRRTLVVRIFPNGPVRPFKEERRVNHESLQHRLGDTERTEILRALEAANGIVGGPNGAVARLGIKRSTLQLCMQKHGIRVSRTTSDER